MNEYLENLKNTQGKKTPPRLINILPRLNNIMKESPTKSEDTLARDFRKYGAFHKVNKEHHNLNDSQDMSLSEASDSENESSDKLVTF